MKPLYFKSRVLFLWLLTIPACGCLFRSHEVKREINPATLKSATKADLIAYVDSQAARVQSMQATVDIDTTVGGEKKGRVTEYQQIRGYVLARKPAMLRMIGLFPILRNRAFDMVSDGQQFKVWLPTKNRLVVGKNDVPTPNPSQPLENLRPNVIYDALLLREIDQQRGEQAVLENGVETVTDNKGHKHELPDYIIDVIHTNGTDFWLSRKIIFSRVDLLPNRQLIYDEKGTLVTDASYTNYKDYHGLNFPSRIEIKRPEEEYDITISMLKLDLNQPLPNDKFVLEQPPGVQVIHLDRSQPQAHNGGGQ
jgi:outer membrane lipoprotein-sorting protein